MAARCLALNSYLIRKIILTTTIGGRHVGDTCNVERNDLKGIGCCLMLHCKKRRHMTWKYLDSRALIHVFSNRSQSIEVRCLYPPIRPGVCRLVTLCFRFNSFYVLLHSKDSSKLHLMLTYSKNVCSERLLLFAKIYNGRKF